MSYLNLSTVSDAELKLLLRHRQMVVRLGEEAVREVEAEVAARAAGTAAYVAPVRSEAEVQQGKCSCCGQAVEGDSRWCYECMSEHGPRQAALGDDRRVMCSVNRAVWDAYAEEIRQVREAALAGGVRREAVSKEALERGAALEPPNLWRGQEKA